VYPHFITLNTTDDSATRGHIHSVSLCRTHSDLCYWRVHNNSEQCEKRTVILYVEPTYTHTVCFSGFGNELYCPVVVNLTQSVSQTNILRWIHTACCYSREKTDPISSMNCISWKPFYFHAHDLILIFLVDVYAILMHCFSPLLIIWLISSILQLFLAFQEEFFSLKRTQLRIMRQLE
jgi:hypothetical protein